MTFDESDLISKWNESYSREENSVLEPYEELVKFLARYVVDRNPKTGELTVKCGAGRSPRDITILDIGCGVGGQSEYLARMGFKVIGCDISSIAIQSATSRCQLRGVDVDFRVVDPSSIPLIPCDIAIACASLDSMPFSRARDWVNCLRLGISKEIGLIFATIIASKRDGKTGEEIVTEIHEYGTVQNYFTADSVKCLFLENGFSVARLDLLESVNLVPGIESRSTGRYSVVAVAEM